MKNRKIITTLIASLFLAGCYHAKTEFDMSLKTGESNTSEANSSEGNSSTSTYSYSEPSYVNDGLVKEIRFASDVMELQIGKNEMVDVYVYPSSAINKTLRWSSSDYTVASIGVDGVVKAIGVGEATITATAEDEGKVTNSFLLKVLPIKPTRLSINPESMTIEVGDAFNITASIQPNNATFKDVSFTSSNPAVADVDEHGNVEGLKRGNADIVVTSNGNSELTKVCKVKVVDVVAKSISLTETEIDLLLDDRYLISPTILPANTTDKSVSYINNNPDIVQVSENGEVSPLKEGVATVVARSNSNPDLEASLTINVREKPLVTKVKLNYNFKDYTSNNVDNIDCADYEVCNALIVPVWFKDSNNYIPSGKKEVVREDIEKAYLGSNEETGWRSVKTFYEEESRGNFTFNGVVTDWFECGLSHSNFASEYSGFNQTISLVDTAVDWYKSTYHVNNMKAFDADKNGHIDAVMLIYGCPDEQKIGGWGDNGNLWAYCYWTDNSARTSDPTSCAFFWASYDFMYGSGHAHESTYCNGDTRYCEIDTHTYIHEFGHIMGLNDYYDYSGAANPAAGFSMQDYNVGGHDPYSCMTLGFVDPYVVTNDAELTIRDFQSSGDLVLITNEFHNSPFDEYILVELYTPTGLNQFDSQHSYSGGYPQGPSTPGLRIWHVDARLLYTRDGRYSANQVTTNPLIPNYNVTLMMSNTYWSSSKSGYCSPLGSNYGDYNELQLIRNNTSATYKPNDTLTSSMLFKQGDTFSLTKFKKQFKKEYYLNSGDAFTFEVTVKSLSNNTATIEIKK